MLNQIFLFEIWKVYKWIKKEEEDVNRYYLYKH